MTATRVRSVAAACWASAALLVASATSAHLRLAPASLVAMVDGADGIVLARSLEATAVRGDRGAEAATPRGVRVASTPFLAVEAIAGRAPRGAFVVEGGAPALRYAAGETVLVLVTAPAAGWRDGVTWSSPQRAGAGLRQEGVRLAAQTAAALRSLWDARHPGARVEGDGAGPPAPPPDPDRTVAALVDLLRAAGAKLRTLAALDLAEIAQRTRSLSPETRARLAAFAADSAADPALRRLVEEALHGLEGAGA